MNDFDYEVLQRKRSTYGARHKKNGSKSRKCTLPQDTMSAAELKRRNGEMSTFNLGKPMGWETFKAMPDDLKREYIIGLRTKYNASDARIAEMLRVSRPTLCRECIRLAVNDGVMRKFNYAEEKTWEEFCNPTPVTLDPLEVITPIGPGEAKEPVEDVVPCEEKARGCAINSGLLQFTGAAPDIAIALMKFLGDREYRISVEFEEVMG